MGRTRKTAKTVEGTQLALDATRAGIYLRVSTEEQADSGLGIDAQRARCLAMATVKGWSVVREYNDAGISGTKDATKRPALAQMLKDAQAGEIDAVIILSLDRLGRNTVLVLSLVTQLAGYSTQLVSCKESLDTTTATGKFALTLFAGLAQLERDQTAERTKAALTELGKGKGYKGGRIPYGYTYAKDGSTMEIDPAAAPVVREIFARRGEGASMQRIADELNARGALSARGVAWRGGSVFIVLENANKYNGGERYGSGLVWPAILSSDPTRAAAD